MLIRVHEKTLVLELGLSCHVRHVWKFHKITEEK
jgi:hypothetical protein